MTLCQAMTEQESSKNPCKNGKTPSRTVCRYLLYRCAPAEAKVVQPAAKQRIAAAAVHAVLEGSLNEVLRETHRATAVKA